MKSFYLKIYQLVFFICLTGFAEGQSILEGYIQLGLQNNQHLIQEQLATQISYEKVAEAKGKYLPDVSFNASYTWADGGRTIDVPAGDLINPAYDGLNQLLGENRYPTNISNASEQLLPNNFHETKIRVIQPILNSKIYYSYQATRAQVSAQEARQQAYENQLQKEIKVGYYHHLSAGEQLKILLLTQEVLTELVTISEHLVKNDKATKEVVYSAKAELSKLNGQIAGARKQVNQSQAYFNFLLDRELTDEILIDSTLTYEPADHFNTATLEKEGLSRRKEVMHMQQNIQANQAQLALNKSHIIPEINLVGDIGYQGFGYTFNSRQDFWLVRLGLTWPLFQGFQHHSKIEQSKLRDQQLNAAFSDLKKKIALEISHAYYGYEEAKEILLARESELTNSKENFRIIAKKYRENLVPPVALNEARTNYTRAQLNEAIARYMLKIKEAELEAAIHLD